MAAIFIFFFLKGVAEALYYFNCFKAGVKRPEIKGTASSVPSWRHYYLSFQPGQ
jgi:hypothetical protein